MIKHALSAKSFGRLCKDDLVVPKSSQQHASIDAVKYYHFSLEYGPVHYQYLVAI
jgi:hypothetical protein